MYLQNIKIQYLNKNVKRMSIVKQLLNGNLGQLTIKIQNIMQIF